MKKEFPLDPDLLQAGHLCLVDKPVGWTSFDVVNKIRLGLKNYRGIKKIKVGHAGTLDPLATGLLVICIGKATKEIDGYQAQNKEYTGTIHLGATTPSYDLETEVDETFPIEHITPEHVMEVGKQFLGVIEQFPPIFSAIKVDGKRAYKHARAGEELVLKSRTLTVDQFDLSFENWPEIDFVLRCSKGTYVRSLAFDLGKALNSGAYLSSLRRTKNGIFDIKGAWKLEDLMAVIQNKDS